MFVSLKNKDIKIKLDRSKSKAAVNHINVFSPDLNKLSVWADVT